MPKKKKKPIEGTTEVESYLHGLFHEFQEQLLKYNALTSELMSLELRIELAAKKWSAADARSLWRWQPENRIRPCRETGTSV